MDEPDSSACTPQNTLFRTGDRVRLMVPTPSGWLGEAVVTHDEPLDDSSVRFVKVAPADESNPIGVAHWSALVRIGVE